MRGYITEIDFDQAEKSFPGIARYYRDLQSKPETFLELIWRYTESVVGCSAVKPDAPTHRDVFPAAY